MHSRRLLHVGARATTVAAAFALLVTAALPLGEGGRSAEPIALPDVSGPTQAGPQPRTQQIVQEAAEEGEAEASLDTLDVAETPAGAEAPPSADANDDARVVARQESSDTADFGLLGVTWDNGTAPEDLEVQVRTRTEGSWTTWTDLEISDVTPAEGAGGRTGTEPMWVGQSDGVAVRLLSASHAPDGAEVVLIDGGTGLAQPAFVLVSDTEPTDDPTTSTSEQTTDTTTSVETTSTPGVAPKPTIVTRKQWGVNRTWEVSCSSPTRAPSARGIVLHHTAGQNAYTKAEAPGIVRGTHLYHTRSLGWCDVGYSFLVDKYGTIYEGRRGGIERQVRGSHAGNWDANLYLTGISMMGNYDTVDVPQALRTAVINLSAWRLSFFGRDAIGKITIDGGQIDIISGHRDIYSAGIRPATATACPGRYGYAWLNGGMRNQVQARIDAAPAGTSPTPSPSPTPTPTPEPEPTVMTRSSGENRYATAAAISREVFTAKGGTVFLASGDAFADALSGGPAAARQKAPVLLAQPGGLPAETVTELERLAPSKIYIVGGEAALSSEVETQARAHAPVVERLAGRDRTVTGVVVSRALWTTSEAVYVASGADYPDALSGGALAAKRGAPILLSPGNRLPQPVARELARLSPSSVTVLGGTSALDDTVLAAIAEAAPDAVVTRLSGADRYATSAVVTKAGWTTSSKVFIAAGMNFPDALAGVPAAAASGAPLLLSRRGCLPAPVADMVAELRPDVRVLLGGRSVLRDSAASTRC